MACDRKTILLISCYADGEATHEEQIRAKAHLEQCAECSKLLEEWKGQCSIFEWAYDITLPEGIESDWLEKLPAKENRMSISERIFNMPAIFHKRSLVWITAAVIIFLVIYHIATLPPILKTGAVMVSQNQQQLTRLEDNIQLRLSPNSKIFRINKKTIRLEQGSIYATVRNGSGLRIITKRIDVTDQGTQFKVGTGINADYVLVNQGLVTVIKGKETCDVKAGQIMIAMDQQKLWVATIPVKRRNFFGMPIQENNNSNSGVPLGKQTRVFVPASGQQLDWDEGIKRFAIKYPDKFGPSYISSSNSESDSLEYPTVISMIHGMKSELNTHFKDMALAAAGEKISSDKWEIPVAFVLIPGVISESELPKDCYYVRLVSNGEGAIVWRFIGSKGYSADYPFSLGKFDEAGSFSEGSDMNDDGTLEYKCLSDEVTKAHYFEMRIKNWPGEIKPLLKLKLRGLQIAQSQKDRLSMLKEINSSIIKSGIVRLNDHPEILYLDSSRKHRLVVVWDLEAGKQICRLSDVVKKGGSGSVTIGVLETDSPLVEPNVEKGIYLIRLVIAGNINSPHLEIATPDGHIVSNWGTVSHSLKSDILINDYHSGGYILDVPSGYGPLQLSCIPFVTENNEYPFRIKVVGRPDENIAKQYDPNESIWIDGWIRVKKP